MKKLAKPVRAKTAKHFPTMKRTTAVDDAVACSCGCYYLCVHYCGCSCSCGCVC